MPACLRLELCLQAPCCRLEAATAAQLKPWGSSCRTVVAAAAKGRQLWATRSVPCSRWQLEGQNGSWRSSKGWACAWLWCRFMSYRCRAVRWNMCRQFCGSMAGWCDLACQAGGVGTGSAFVVGWLCNRLLGPGNYCLSMILFFLCCPIYGRTCTDPQPQKTISSQGGNILRPLPPFLWESIATVATQPKQHGPWLLVAPGRVGGLKSSSTKIVRHGR